LALEPVAGRLGQAFRRVRETAEALPDALGRSAGRGSVDRAAGGSIDVRVSTVEPSGVNRLVRLDFGRTGLEMEVPEGVDVLRPRSAPGLADPVPALRDAMRHPRFGAPLAQLVPRGATVAVSVCDVTRPFPAKTVLPVLIDELPGRRIRLVVATGSHRACTPDELDAMFGPEVLAACELVQHDADDRAAHAQLGTVPGSDVPVLVDRAFLAADARLTLGFTEPHFFAGFSGGPKMVAPGLAALETIVELHSEPRIGDPRATWGVMDGNPVHDPVRAIADRAGVTFALDVVLASDKSIAAVFAGELAREHAAACDHVRETAMVGVPGAYDVVVTTNSGYPLDQNLYQCVKGLKAASGITRDGGTVILAAECADGLPAHGRYAELLASSPSPRDFLERLARGEVHERDQWQVQVQATICDRARILAKTPGVSPDDLRTAWMTPVDDVAAALADALAANGPGARAAVLPEGPQTIAYVR
jgi:nickel-dependent lactate racemase